MTFMIRAYTYSGKIAPAVLLADHWTSKSNRLALIVCNDNGNTLRRRTTDLLLP
ncbi:hypothetical protein D3C85_1712860 [compost metagenome]